MNVLDFLNNNAGALTLVFSFVVALSTAIYAVLTARLVAETKKMRSAQTEPDIFLSIQAKEESRNFVDLVLQNIGPGPAYNIKFRVNKDYDFGKDRKVSEIGFIKKGFTSIPPGMKVSYFLTSLYGKVEDYKDANFSIEVSYENYMGCTYSKEFIMEFSALLGMRWIGKPPLVSIVENLQRLQEDIHSLIYSSDPKLKVISYTKQDMEEEYRKVLDDEREEEYMNSASK